jgi:PIN domain nuclease of toxin-antitoxin system
MPLLLDTHVLIWWLENGNRLSAHARTQIVSAVDVYVSSASLWELVIKIGARKIRMDLNLLLPVG